MDFHFFLFYFAMVFSGRGHKQHSTQLIARFDSISFRFASFFFLPLLGPDVIR